MVFEHLYSPRMVEEIKEEKNGTPMKAPMEKWTKSTFLATFSRKFIFVT